MLQQKMLHYNITQKYTDTFINNKNNQNKLQTNIKRIETIWVKDD